MTQIKCNNKQCNHKWEYKGKSKIYVTCPQCYKKIKITTPTTNSNICCIRKPKEDK